MRSGCTASRSLRIPDAAWTDLRWALAYVVLAGRCPLVFLPQPGPGTLRALQSPAGRHALRTCFGCRRLAARTLWHASLAACHCGVEAPWRRRCAVFPAVSVPCCLSSVVCCPSDCSRLCSVVIIPGTWGAPHGGTEGSKLSTAWGWTRKRLTTCHC